jgi:hydroxymethylpyrimidine pyrophosphatase-like HAD family hydrolase
MGASGMNHDNGVVPVPPDAIRLVATDLDGTLLRHDGVVTQRTRDVLRAVEASGRTLVFVTGRPPRWMPMVVEATGHAGIAICANGAVRYDLHTDRILDVTPLHRAPALEAAARLRELLPGIAFATERVIPPHTSDGDLRVEFAREPEYRAKWPTPEHSPVARLDDLIGNAGVIKILARVPRADDPEPGPHVAPPRIGSSGGTEVDELLAAASATLGDLVTVTHSNPADTLLEISAPGVSKASALSDVAASLGIGAESVVAFGDQPNDLPMLRWAGLSYAVANAHPEVLAAVDHHAPSVDDEGVPRTLVELLNLIVP